jgi:hypothetical protein
MKSKNRLELFLLWCTSPEELRELAEMLEKHGNVSFSIRTVHGLNVEVMLEKAKQ